VKKARNAVDGVKVQEGNNSLTLLVFAPVYGVASTGTSGYAPADMPCGRSQIRRNPE
jgi:hypothetical protein